MVDVRYYISFCNIINLMLKEILLKKKKISVDMVDE